MDTLNYVRSLVEGKEKVFLSLGFDKCGKIKNIDERDVISYINGDNNQVAYATVEDARRLVVTPLSEDGAFVLTEDQSITLEDREPESTDEGPAVEDCVEHEVTRPKIGSSCEISEVPGEGWLLSYQTTGSSGHFEISELDSAVDLMITILQDPYWHLEMLNSTSAEEEEDIGEEPSYNVDQLL